MTELSKMKNAIHLHKKFQVLGESGNKLIFVLRGIKDSPVMIYVEDEEKVYTSGLGLMCKGMIHLRLIFMLLGYNI